MVRVLAVNNYPTPERFERLKASLEVNGANVTTIDWREASASKFNSFDGVALSGSPEMLSQRKTQQKFRREADAIVEAKVPVLGVCYGHQLMAHAFGGRVKPDVAHVLRYVKTKTVKSSPLFKGLPSPSMLIESRYEIVEAVPQDFELLAVSETSEVAAMRHKSLPLWGVQSHPERYSTLNPDGKLLVGNFVGLLR